MQAWATAPPIGTINQPMRDVSTHTPTGDDGSRAASTVSVAAALSRRSLCFATLATGLGGMAALVPNTAQAGGQVEEPLMDSVRTALTSAVAQTAPPIPSFADTESKLAYLRWQGEMSERLARKKADFTTRQEFLQTLWYESKRAGLEPSLVLGLVEVESNFRKFAISRVGARGYMQIMPFWMRLIGNSEVARLFHMQTNLRFGCVILRHYLDREKGDTFMGLGRYNGSRGRPEYPNAVFAAQKKWLPPA